jgi:4-amino-4-deoxy-L-arabinose transferase-like glycosyltransferase
MDNDAQPHQVVAKGLLGTVSAALGFAVSHLHEVEQWLRVATSLVGFVVALLTAASLYTGMSRKRRRRRDDDN